MDNNIQNRAGDENEEWLSIGDAAKLLNVSRDTLRRWEKKGKIKVYRSPTNRRRYKKSEIEQSFSPGRKSPPSIKTSSSQKTQKTADSNKYIGQSRRDPAVTAQMEMSNKQVKTPSTSVTTQGTEKTGMQNYAQTQAGETKPPVNAQAAVVQQPQSPLKTSPVVTNQATNSYASNQQSAERENRQIPVKVEAESKPEQNLVANKQVKDERRDEEILEIRPQTPVNTAYTPPQGTKREEEVKDKKGEKSGNYMKVAILIVSIFLIIAGLVIVGLVFLYPSQSTPMLSPV
jgi:excisionase family DNA binding protein